MKRAGHSLIEVLVAMSIASALMAVAVGLFGSLLKTEHKGRLHWERTQTVMRLAEQFRADVAAAREATIVEAAAGDRLRLPGPAQRSVEYWRDGERVRREERQGQSVARREAYILADLTAAGFVLSDGFAAIELTARDDAKGVGNNWRIEARLAKDRRFSEIAAAEEEE